MPSPQSHILIMTSRGKQFILRMCCKTPQLPTVSKDDLVEPSLQRSFKNVVSCGANIDVSVVSSGSLRVDCANTASIFWKLNKSFVPCEEL